MRRFLLIAAAAALSSAPSPAAAHAPATLVMSSPAEGAVVTGRTVRVVVEGRGGRDAAVFRLDLDGRTVDATGRIGGVFSTLSVAPGKRLAIDLAVEPGAHTLTATPNADADAVQTTVVRRFTVVAGAEPDGDRGVPWLPAVAGVVAGAALFAALVRLRGRGRPRRDQGVSPTSRGPLRDIHGGASRRRRRRR